MKPWKSISWLGLLLPLPCLGQNSDLPHNDEAYHMIDRIDIMGIADTTVPTDVKPYDRETVEAVFDLSDTYDLSPKEQAWFNLIRAGADDEYVESLDKKALIGPLYANGRDFYRYRGEKLRLYVNPIVYWSAGMARDDFDGAEDQHLTYRNTRGLRVRGSIYDKVGFFTEVTENQAKYPQFIKNNYLQYDRLWGEGFLKIFDNDGPTSNYGFDYFNARGYLTYSPVPEFRIKFGKDRFHLGNGEQSLLLSDHANDYLFLHLRTRIWKLEYHNIFNQMIDYYPNKPDIYGTYPRKFAVFHQLLFRPNRKISVGFFESVVYSPTLPGQQRGFEIEYLNPIIFYRSVEQALGSPDNSMLGATAKVNFLNHFQFYGQFLLDDLNFRTRTVGPGFHGNKWGWQGGLKYINVAGIAGLDIQAEYNRVRPYTYSHFNPAANYSHYNQFLAHPLGANFHETRLTARWQATPRISLYGLLSYAFKGENSDSVNYGGNPLLTYTTRFQDYNNVVGQGIENRITQAYGRLSYRIQQLNAFAELEGRFRKQNEFTQLSLMGTLRMNIPHKAVKF